MDLPELAAHELAIRLALSAGLGAVVGFEREWRDRTAGLRTHMLVCVGSAVFTMISAYGFAEWYQSFDATSRSGVVSDPSRIAAQIVTGVGFLGAGAIFRSDDGIKGLTTAASIWAVAAIGMAVGAGQYVMASAATLSIMVVLVALRQVSGRIKRMNQGERRPLEVIIANAATIGPVFDLVANAGGQVSDFTANRRRRGETGRILRFEVELPVDESFSDLVGSIAMADGVDSVSTREVSA